MSLIILGGTIVDSAADEPIQDRCIWIEHGRIKAVCKRDELGIAPTAKVIDARGKYIIPGLMNANVHLLMDIRLETLARYLDRFEDLIVEAAQVALKNGLTTVFDTWGPRRFMMAVRDRINAGETIGSRIFCAGNIVGLDGPLSQDFIASDLPSVALAKRINAIWVENVGRHLMWLPPEQVASHVRAYIGRGIDFLKYASNGHGGAFKSAFLVFSPRVQSMIVEEAHRARITAQAHATSVEGLRIAIEAGCDLVQHANISGPVPIPEDTLELFAARKTGAVIFPFTQNRFDNFLRKATDTDRTWWQASDINARNLIRSGCRLVLANDGFVLASGVATDPFFNRPHLAPGDDNLFDLAAGHFAWFRAMEEKRCPPMDMLRAATRNVAVAYGKDQDLGTLEPGKIADMLILDKDPLQSAENYRSIHLIVKDGAIVDREALPAKPILTAPLEPPVEEEAAYRPFLASHGNFPVCPMCVCR